MWQLVLLANLVVDKPSADEMVRDDLCICPRYILSKEAVRLIQQNKKADLKVSLALLDRVLQKRYEGQIERIISKIDNEEKQRWDVRGKDMRPVQFKDEESMSYTGVSFRWI
jgi:hypothetical protein